MKGSLGPQGDRQRRRIRALFLACILVPVWPEQPASAVMLSTAQYAALQWTSAVAQYCRPYPASTCLVPLQGPYWAWDGIKGEIRTPSLVPTTEDSEEEWGLIAMAFSMANDSNIALGWYTTDTVNNPRTTFDNFLQIQSTASTYYGTGYPGVQSPGSSGQFRLYYSDFNLCWYAYINGSIVGYTLTSGGFSYGVCIFAPPAVAVAGAVIRSNIQHIPSFPQLPEAVFGHTTSPYALEIRRRATGAWELWDTALTDGTTSRYDTAYGIGSFGRCNGGPQADARYYFSVSNAYYRVKAFGGQC